MGRRHSHKGPRSTETPAVNGKANSSAKTDVHEKILEGIEAENSAFSVFKNSEKANTAEGDLSARAGNQTGKLLASEARKKKKRNDGLNEKPRILAYPGYKRSPKKAKKRMSDGSKPNESNIVEDCSVPNGDSSKRKRKKRRAEPTESESGSFDSSTIKRSKGAKPFNVLSSVVMAAESSKADKNSSKVVHKKTFKKVINGKVVEYVNETEVQNPPKDERRNKMNKEILESQNDEEEPIIFEDVQLVDVGGNENLSQSVSDHYDVENEGEVESIEGEEVEDEDSETEDETEEDENEGELEGMEFIDDEAVECSDAEEEDEGEEEEDDDDDEDEEEEAEATKVADMNEFIEEHCIIYGPKDCKDSQKTIDFSDMPFSKFPNSVQNAMDAWSWITSPCEVKEFFETVFQQKALIVHRENSKYYGNLYSTEMFVDVLQKHYIEYGTNVNVAVYKDGVRTTPNGEGRVYPHEIKAHLQAGRSIQFINPMTYCDSVWHLCDILQEMFGSFVGANTYLTPSGTAGFAPHWDDIDAFLMQIEGRKHWKVWAPDDPDLVLPRGPSGHLDNFSEVDMEGCIPVFDGWLEQGDLLYIPRGFIHGGYTEPSTHSLHLTVSVCRQTAFIDMMEKLIPTAVTTLGDAVPTLRESLPTGYLDMGGVLPFQYPLEHEMKKRISSVMNEHMKMLFKHTSHMWQSAIDMMAREYMRTSLPPMLTQEEKRLSAIGDKGFNVLDMRSRKFTLKTQIKFIRRHAQRLIFETESRCFVIHRMSNARVSEGRPEVSFDLDEKLADGFGQLLETYPDWEYVSELACESKADKIKLAQILFDNGLIMAKF